MRKKRFSDEDCIIFMQKYPIMSNKEVAAFFQISTTTVKNYASELGLKKNSLYMKHVKSEASKKGLESRWKR